MKKILVIEDDLSIRELLVEILEEEGYDVVSGANGLEALELLKSNDPDLIVMDIMMPLMDGYKLKSELLKNAKWGSIPVLAMSAQNQAVEKLSSHGFSNFINKPLEMDYFLQAVNSLA